MLLAAQHGGESPEQDLYIQPPGPLVDIRQIEFHPGIEVDAVASADLPQAGKAGPHAETPVVPALVLSDFPGQGRPRPYQAHVPAKDVPQLGKLVQAPHAQVAADAIYPW